MHTGEYQFSELEQMYNCFWVLKSFPDKLKNNKLKIPRSLPLLNNKNPVINS